MLNNKKGAGRPPVPYKTKLVQYRVPESEVEEFKYQVAPIIEVMRIEAMRKADVIKSVCDCGKPISDGYAPCCSLKCWYDKFS